MPEDALSPKELAVPLLARGMSTDAVGTTVGVNGRTVRRWREDPTFERQVQDVRQTVLDETVAALTAAVRKAVDTLTDALTDDHAGIRVRAASELIRSLPALAEHAAFEARLAALEGRLTEQEKPTWPVSA
ncbi:hypothetical protein [Streptomyces hydrogenans]|uniref:hypothetical protein n=1 Tax=Streptomyces hydrogenans TaxID=1873719 RepID=UPI0037F5239D